MSRSRPPKCRRGRGCGVCGHTPARHELAAPTVDDGLAEYDPIYDYEMALLAEAVAAFERGEGPDPFEDPVERRLAELRAEAQRTGQPAFWGEPILDGDDEQ